MRHLPLVEVIESLESGSRPRGGAGRVTRGVLSVGGEQIGRHGRLRSEKPRYVPEAHFAAMRSGVLRGEETLLVKDGATTGKAGFAGAELPPRAAVNEHVFLLRPRRELVVPRYLFHFFHSDRGRRAVLRSFRGAAVGGIPRDFVDSIRVPLPDLGVQEERARVLDRCIELDVLAERRCDLVARLVRAAFDRTGTDRAHVPLEELVDPDRGIGYGVVQRGPERADGVPLLRIGDITGNRVDPAAVVRTSPEIAARHARTLLRGGEVLVSIRGTVGRAALVPASCAGCNVARELAVVPLRDGTSAPFVHAFLLSRGVQRRLTAAAVGVAQRGITLSDLRRLPVPVPTDAERARFAAWTAGVADLSASARRGQRRAADLLGAHQRLFFGR